MVVLRTSIDRMNENVFKLTKERSRNCPPQTIIDADYADDIALLAKTPNQAETSYIVWNELLLAEAFLSNSSRIDTAVWIHYMGANKTYGEKT